MSDLASPPARRRYVFSVSLDGIDVGGVLRWNIWPDHHVGNETPPAVAADALEAAARAIREKHGLA